MTTNATATNSGTTTNNTAAGAADAAAKTRAERLNRKVADAHPITDAKSAQAYADAVLAATATEKNQPMYNSSGFTTPASLAGQDVANLVRMSVSISNAIAQKVSDPAQSDAASAGLGVIRNYSDTAVSQAQEAEEARVLAAAAKINARKAAAKGK